MRRRRLWSCPPVFSSVLALLIICPVATDCALSGYLQASQGEPSGPSGERLPECGSLVLRRKRESGKRSPLSYLQGTHPIKPSRRALEALSSSSCGRPSPASFLDILRDILSSHSDEGSWFTIDSSLRSLSNLNFALSFCHRLVMREGRREMVEMGLRSKGASPTILCACKFAQTQRLTECMFPRNSVPGSCDQSRHQPSTSSMPSKHCFSHCMHLFIYLINK